MRDSTCSQAPQNNPRHPSNCETVRQFRATDDGNVSFEASQETKDTLFDAMLDWFFKHEAFYGEGIMQCDTPQIEAAPFLSDVADNILKFKHEEEDV